MFSAAHRPLIAPLSGIAVLVLGLAPLLVVAATDYDAKREKMVHKQIEARDVSDPLVLDAMRTVPRHRFVPDNQLRRAYADTPLPIGHGQTISQPFIVAFMTEQLKPRADMTVLEIGTGSAYQAAVLGQIVEQVYTVEIVEPLASQATRRLRRLGYDNVVVRHGDGYEGWAEHAPFDAIIVTAAAEYIPPPLLAQLKPGGRMMIPVGSPFSTQRLMLVEKSANGEIRSRNLMPVRFVPFTRQR